MFAGVYSYANPLVVPQENCLRADNVMFERPGCADVRGGVAVVSVNYGAGGVPESVQSFTFFTDLNGDMSVVVQDAEGYIKMNEIMVSLPIT